MVILYKRLSGVADSLPDGFPTVCSGQDSVPEDKLSEAATALKTEFDILNADIGAPATHAFLRDFATTYPDWATCPNVCFMMDQLFENLLDLSTSDTLFLGVIAVIPVLGRLYGQIFLEIVKVDQALEFHKSKSGSQLFSLDISRFIGKWCEIEQTLLGEDGRVSLSPKEVFIFSQLFKLCISKKNIILIKPIIAALSDEDMTKILVTILDLDQLDRYHILVHDPQTIEPVLLHQLIGQLKLDSINILLSFIHLARLSLYAEESMYSAEGLDELKANTDPKNWFLGGYQGFIFEIYELLQSMPENRCWEDLFILCRNSFNNLEDLDRLPRVTMVDPSFEEAMRFLSTLDGKDLSANTLFPLAASTLLQACKVSRSLRLVPEISYPVISRFLMMVHTPESSLGAKNKMFEIYAVGAGMPEMLLQTSKNVINHAMSLPTPLPLQLFTNGLAKSDSDCAKYFFDILKSKLNERPTQILPLIKLFIEEQNKTFSLSIEDKIELVTLALDYFQQHLSPSDSDYLDVVFQMHCFMCYLFETSFDELSFLFNQDFVNLLCLFLDSDDGYSLNYHLFFSRLALCYFNEPAPACSDVIDSVGDVYLLNLFFGVLQHPSSDSSAYQKQILDVRFDIIALNLIQYVHKQDMTGFMTILSEFSDKECASILDKLYLMLPKVMLFPFLVEGTYRKDSSDSFKKGDSLLQCLIRANYINSVSLLSRYFLHCYNDYSKLFDNYYEFTGDDSDIAPAAIVPLAWLGTQNDDGEHIMETAQSVDEKLKADGAGAGEGGLNVLNMLYEGISGFYKHYVYPGSPRQQMPPEEFAKLTTSSAKQLKERGFCPSSPERPVSASSGDSVSGSPSCPTSPRKKKTNGRGKKKKK